MSNWYEIRVKGHLEAGWLDWFEGLQIKWLYEACWINYGVLA